MQKIKDIDAFQPEILMIKKSCNLIGQEHFSFLENFWRKFLGKIFLFTFLCLDFYDCAKFKKVMNRFQEKLVPDVQTRREKEKHEFKFIGPPLPGEPECWPSL